MSDRNPTGWKLEELADQLAEEIEFHKSPKIADDKRPEARHVLRNNQRIVGHLKIIAALQRDSYDVLSRLGPNQGPTGTPRIGAGSPGYSDQEDDGA